MMNGVMLEGLLKPILQFKDIGNIALQRLQHIGFVVKCKVIVNQDIQQPSASDIVENCCVILALIKRFLEFKKRRMKHLLDISTF